MNQTYFHKRIKRITVIWIKYEMFTDDIRFIYARSIQLLATLDNIHNLRNNITNKLPTTTAIFEAWEYQYCFFITCHTQFNFFNFCLTLTHIHHKSVPNIMNLNNCSFQITFFRIMNLSILKVLSLTCFSCFWAIEYHVWPELYYILIV